MSDANAGEAPSLGHGERFARTLPPRQRRLAGRLEGFGDIVFGFAVSQCALHLTTAAGHIDIAHPIAVLLYFGSFALLASLWLTYHRMLSGAFAPAAVDLALVFAYLALVGLLPYAMYAISHSSKSATAVRPALAEYSTIFAVTMLIAATTLVRNLRRGYELMEPEERRIAWGDVCFRLTLAGMMLIGLTLDLTLGPAASTPAYLAIVPVMRVARLRIRKSSAPSRRRLRLPELAEA